MNKFNKFSPKPNFSFSWSKVKNFETCPRKYYEVDILKNYKEESEALDYGFRMHDAAAKRVHGTPLPAEFQILEKWIEGITKDSKEPNVVIQTELKLAIDKNKNPCGWLDSKTYYRGVIDFLKIKGKVALIVDWKSGKVKEDIPQLGLFAQLVFSHYNFIRAIKVMYIWIEANDSTEENLYVRDMVDLWREINPRVTMLEMAHKNNDFPPKKSGLCKNYCPVVTCEHNGR